MMVLMKNNTILIRIRFVSGMLNDDINEYIILIRLRFVSGMLNDDLMKINIILIPIRLNDGINEK